VPCCQKYTPTDCFFRDVAHTCNIEHSPSLVWILAIHLLAT